MMALPRRDVTVSGQHFLTNVIAVKPGESIFARTQDRCATRTKQTERTIVEARHWAREP
jgi:hypothetical protein